MTHETATAVMAFGFVVLTLAGAEFALGQAGSRLHKIAKLMIAPSFIAFGAGLALMAAYPAQ